MQEVWNSEHFTFWGPFYHRSKLHQHRYREFSISLVSYSLNLISTCYCMVGKGPCNLIVFLFGGAWMGVGQMEISCFQTQ